MASNTPVQYYHHHGQNYTGSHKFLQITSDSDMWGKSAVGALTLILFDYLLTLDAEITYVWRQRWSLTKVLFFLCRYVGIFNAFLLATVMTTHRSHFFLCRRWTWYLVTAILTALVSTNALLALRLVNLFRSNKYVRYLVPLLFVFEHVAISVALFLIVHYSVVIKNSPRPVLGCMRIISRAPHILTVMTSLPSLIVTSIYVTLVLHKFRRLMQERSSFKGHKVLREVSRLTSGFSLVIRSSIIVYLACAGMVFINVVFTLVFEDRELQTVPFPWLVAVYTIAGSRLVTTLGGDMKDSPGVYVYAAGNDVHTQQTNDDELSLQQDLQVISSQGTIARHYPSFFALE